jgi:hypothetical protein
MRFVLVLMLFGNFVLAQDNFIGRTLDAGAWLEGIEGYTNLYTPTIVGLARQLAALALACVLVTYFINPNPLKLVTILLRALVVSALLILTPQITELTLTTTEGLRDWGMNQLQPTLDEGGQEMGQLGRDSGALVVAMTLPEVAIAGVAAKSASSLAFREAGVVMGGVSRWLNLAVIPILVCVVIVHLMGLLALISVAVANILFPIACAMLMFSPRDGEKWLGNYISTVVGALFIVLLLPLAFQVGFDIIVVGPVRTINENFDDFNARFEARTQPPELVGIDVDLQSLYEAQDTIVDECFADGDPTCIQHPDLLADYTALENQIADLQNERRTVSGNWWSEMLRTLQGTAEGLLADLRNWFLRLVLLLFGSIAASYLIWRLSSVIAGLVGGVALEAVHFASAPLSALSNTGRGLQGQLRDASRRVSPGSQQSSTERPTPPGPGPASTGAVPVTGSGMVYRGPSSAGGKADIIDAQYRVRSGDELPASRRGLNQGRASGPKALPGGKA